ncbi:hypothetical protein OCU04_001240 [Sclerotinia nivalis]|uniref:Uncharacterized protein n=1 Tax=Sclerotinia nivalis TaxID=352851 RepID=A0A9X0AXQ1_9HELO|nr:hypothetical protein OCU04_001240 [Sclerotinia nivalis]
MSFFGGNWEEEESFDLSEHDEFLNLPEGAFFNLLEDSKDKGDELSITNSADKSPSNKYSPNEEDMNRMILQETVDEFEVNSLRSEKTCTEEAETLETEVGNDLFMLVDTPPEEEMKDDQYFMVILLFFEMNLQCIDDPKQVPNSSVQCPTTMSPVISPSEIKQHPSSATKASSFSGISNTMGPLFEPASSSPAPFLSAEDHRYNQDDREISPLTPTPSIRQREKNSIDIIIEEHNKRMAEKAVTRKANSTLLGYNSIQKKTPVKKGHRYSGSLDESVGKFQTRPSYNHHGVPGSLNPRQECQVNFDDQFQTQGFQEKGPSQQMGQIQQMQQGPSNLNSFQQMGQSQTIPPNLDYFQQVSHGKMYSYPQKHTSSNTEQQAQFQPPALTQSQASPYSRFEHQNTPMSTQSFQQLGQQMMNPSIKRFYNRTVKREGETSMQPKKWPVSHNQPLQLPRFMNPQEQYYSFQQMGHTQNNSGFSHINYRSILDEPHSPLFPERNSWTPRTNTNLHVQAHVQQQTPTVQEPQFGTQQHTNMSNGRSTTPFSSFPPSSFTSERNSDQPLESLLDPHFPHSSQEQGDLSYRPKK